jgi:GT2 family glycosyltransferase
MKIYNRIRSLGRRAPQAGGAQRPRADASAGERRRRQVDELLASGIFDPDYYTAAVGQDFRSVRVAAAHCVKSGMRRSISPNPLLDIASLPPKAKKAWRSGNVTALLRYLRSTPAGELALSPLFDAACAPGDPAQKCAHRAGALGHFLATADDSTPLPVPPSYRSPAPSLGVARRAMIQQVAKTAEQQRLTEPRISRGWNADRERSWKATTMGQSMLPAEGGPIVSVIMPVPGGTDSMAEGVASVQRQSLQRWELLVVDRGSSGHAAGELKRLAQSDERVHLVPAQHVGVSEARNLGLRQARGEYVVFLDSRSAWQADFLALTVAAMQSQPLDAAYTATRLTDPATGKVAYRAYRGGLEALRVQNHIDLNTFLVRTSLAKAAGGFDEELRGWADHDFAIRIASLSEPTFLPFIGGEQGDAFDTSVGTTTTQDDGWQFVTLGRHWVDWPELVHQCGQRSESTTSIVVPTYQDWRMTTRLVHTLLEDAETCGLDIEVIVVDNGSRRETGTQLAAWFLNEPRVRYARLPRNLNFSIGCNYGFSLSRGATVVFLNNDTVPRKGWLTHMLPLLRDDSVRGVQPLLLYPDDTIQTAGTVFAADGFLPTHFLVGHPPEDAHRIENRRFRAVTAAALLMRAEEVASLRGFDPIFMNGMEDVDLCLRATQRFGGHFVVEPTARVTHLEGKSPGRRAAVTANRARLLERWRSALTADTARYADVGFTVAHLAADNSVHPAARPIIVRSRPDLSSPRLRWGIKLPSIPGPLGDAWGDTHFASSLATALRRHGQDVVSYRRGTHSSSMSYLDDVVLGIRGLEVITPQPGKLNILWIISHPDDVDPAELSGFDVVFAASAPWSRWMSELCARPVLPLHQAVDVERLISHRTPIGLGTRPIFVGSMHAQRHRQAVLDAVEADVRLVIHGPGWEDTPAASCVASSYVPNSDLPHLYREQGLVLADHWPDMAKNGFIANRVFDAVAAGARVISDDVRGIEEMFDGMVRVYRDVDDIRRLCARGENDLFPPPEILERTSQRVAEEHSFDARARVLVETAVRGLRELGEAAGDLNR